MTAFVLHDLGSRRESRAWFATAARAACPGTPSSRGLPGHSVRPRRQRPGGHDHRRPFPASDSRGLGHPDARASNDRSQPACSHHDGDTEQACRRTVAALTALPSEYRTGLVRRRGLDLYEAIPAQHHYERAVRDLRDALAA
ncbi:hypothetical protein SBD_1838 [Streptomyces bottropensis ATCC 25435]|jgi:hypothetical protein|uniref:Uncharacterized protein n=1 Tax=Streptomyces bottropensis ATCC 25435 TaxID=1054862 RepID=M3FUX2_9ACTN|nr:hypothetical protein SBD_1838 [Streptomyces bottropensis ATCC 25435]